MAKSPAWTRKEGKNPNGGLNAKGRASAKKQGMNLKPPQPEGGKRRDSFCARMEGMKKKLTSEKTAKDPNSRINKSLKTWNCQGIIMAKTPAQLNAAILANRQRNAPIFAERAARAKETGQDLRTVGRQMRDEAHQASLKRLYGEDLDTTNPDAVNAARAAKQAAAAQARMGARQVRDADFAAKQAIGEKQAEEENAARYQRARQAELDRVAASGAAEDAARSQKQADTIARMNAFKATAPVAAPAAPPMPEPQVLPQQNNPTGPGMKRGGRVKKMASGGMTSKVSSASKRGDGIAQRGKTRGRYI